MLDLGFEHLDDDVEIENSTLEDLYEKEIELLKLSAAIDNEFYKLQKIQTGTINASHVKQIIEQEAGNLSPAFEKLIFDNFEQCGISVSMEGAIANLPGMVTTGMEKVAYGIRKIIAWIKDFFKKYITFQRIRKKQLTKKLAIMKTVDFETIEDKDFTAIYGADICKAMEKDALMEMGEGITKAKRLSKMDYIDNLRKNKSNVLVKIAKVLNIHVVTFFSKFGITGEFDSRGDWIATKEAAKPQSKSVYEWGYRSKDDIVETIENVLSACDYYMNDLKFSDIVDDISKDVANARDDKDFSTLDRQNNILWVSFYLHTQSSIIKHAGQLLTDVEKSVLSIPTK